MSLLEEKQEMTLQPTSSTPTVVSQAQITLVREGLAPQEMAERPGKPCLQGQSALFTPASNSLIITGESAKVIMKVKALGPSPAEGRDPRPQTFVLTPAATRWATPAQGGELARMLPTAMDLGQILHGPKPVLLTKANGGGGQVSALGEETLIRVKERPPQIGPQATWRMPNAATRPQLPPGGVHSGSLGDISLSCSSKGVYENFRRWQQYKTLARRHFPNSPDAEAVSCFLIPVLRSLARLKPEMRIEEGVPRAVQEWERISNFDRMVFYEMAEKFMEFEEEEELQLQKVQLSSQYQHAPVLPSALRLPDTKRESPAAAEITRQQVYFPKKAAAKTPQPKRRQRRPAARAITQMAAKEVPPEAVSQYVEIMDGLKPRTAVNMEGAHDQEEEEPAPDQELLNYIHRLCDIDTFVSKVEAIIHPGFLADLLSPEKDRDPLSLTDELEEEENLTVDELVQKRLLSLSEGETSYGGPQFTSTPYQSDEEDEDSKMYTSRSPGFSGSQRSSTSHGLKRSSLSSEDSSRPLEAKASPTVPQAQVGSFVPKRQPHLSMGTLALDSSLLQQKSDSGSLDSSASDGQGQGESREAQEALIFPKVCDVVPTVKVASMEKGQRNSSTSKIEGLETKMVHHWQVNPMQSVLLSPLVSTDGKSQEEKTRIDINVSEGSVKTLTFAVPEGMRSKEILVGNLNAEDLSCPSDQGLTQGNQSRISEPRLNYASSTTVSQLRDHRQEMSSQQLANVQNKGGLGPLISPPDQESGLQLQARHLPDQINQPKLQANHLQLKDIHIRLQDNNLLKQDNNPYSQNNHTQSQSSSLQNQTKHPQPQAHLPQHQFNSSISGAPDLTQNVRERSQQTPSGYALAVLVDSKSSLVASLTKCHPGNGIQPLGNEIRMNFNCATATSPLEHNASEESKQQQLEASGSKSAVTFSTDTPLSKFPIQKGSQKQLESQCDSKLDLAYTMAGTLTYYGVSMTSECHGNNDSQLAVAHSLISSTVLPSEQGGNQAWSTTQCNSKPHLTCANCIPIDYNGQQGSCNPKAERDEKAYLQPLEIPHSQCITMKGRQSEEVYTSTVLGDTASSVKCSSEARSHHYQLNFTQPVLNLESPSSLSTTESIRDDMLKEGMPSSENWVYPLNPPKESSVEYNGGDTTGQNVTQNCKAYMTLTCPVDLQSVPLGAQEENLNLEVITMDSEWACSDPRAVCPTKPDSCQQKLKQEEVQGSEIRMKLEYARTTSATQDGDQEQLHLPWATNAEILMDLTNVLAVPSTANKSQEQILQQSNSLNSHSRCINQLTESPTACNSDLWCQDHQVLLLDHHLDLQRKSASISQDCSKEEKKQSLPIRNPQLNLDSPFPLTRTSETNSSQKRPKDHKTEGPSSETTSENPLEELSINLVCYPPTVSNTAHCRSSSTNTFDEDIQQENWNKDMSVIPLWTKALEKGNSPHYAYGANGLESKTVAVGEGTSQVIVKAIGSDTDVVCSMTLPPAQDSSKWAEKLKEACPSTTSWSPLQDAWSSLHSTVSLKPDHDVGSVQENSNGMPSSGVLHYNAAQGPEQKTSIPDDSLAQATEESNSRDESLEHPVSEKEMKPSHQPREQPQIQTSTKNQPPKTADKKVMFMRKEILNSTDNFGATDGWVNQEQLELQIEGFISRVKDHGQAPEAKENLLQNCSSHHLPGTNSTLTTKEPYCYSTEVRRDIQVPSASHTYSQSNSLILFGGTEARPRSIGSVAQGDDMVTTITQPRCDTLEQTQKGKGKRKFTQANMDHLEGGSVAKMMMLKAGQEGSLTISSLVSEEKFQEDPNDRSWDFRIVTLTRHPKRDLSNRVLRRSKRLNSS